MRIDRPVDKRRASHATIIFVEVEAGSPKSIRETKPRPYPVNRREAWKPAQRPPGKAERLANYLDFVRRSDEVIVARCFKDADNLDVDGAVDGECVRVGYPAVGVALCFFVSEGVGVAAAALMFTVGSIAVGVGCVPNVKLASLDFELDTLSSPR